MTVHILDEVRLTVLIERDHKHALVRELCPLGSGLVGPVVRLRRIAGGTYPAERLKVLVHAFVDAFNPA